MTNALIKDAPTPLPDPDAPAGPVTATLYWSATGRFFSGGLSSSDAPTIDTWFYVSASGAGFFPTGERAFVDGDGKRGTLTFVPGTYRQASGYLGAPVPAQDALIQYEDVENEQPGEGGAGSGGHWELVDPGTPETPETVVPVTTRVCITVPLDWLTKNPQLPEGATLTPKPDGSALLYCDDLTIYQTVPGTPATPPRYEFVPDEQTPTASPGNGVGWNGGARSVQAIAGDAAIEFKPVTGLVSAAVGFEVPQGASLADRPIDSAQFMTRHMQRHAFWLERGQLYVREDGYSRLFVGSYVPGDLLRIERAAGVTTYKKNGAVVYTSSNALNTERTNMVAMLYAPGDSIDEPKIIAVTPAETGAELSFLPAELNASMAGGRLYMGLSKSMRPLRGVGSFQGTPEPAYMGANAFMSPMQGIGLMAEPNRWSADLSFQPMQILAGRAYMAADLQMRAPAMNATFEDLTDGVALYSGLAAADSLRGAKLIAVVMNTQGVILAVLGMNIVVDAELPAAAAMSVTYGTDRALLATIHEFLLAGDAPPVFDQAGQVWIINTETGASGMYEAYDFNSYGLLDGQAFGVKSDGVYLLDGDDDEGQPIRASAAIGKTDFGTRQEKRLEAAYLGVSSTGGMLLKVTLPDGTEYVYEARTSSEALEQQRIDVGRGIRATFLTFEVFNQEGADFELESAEFFATNTTRRI
ncbi:hypothetical protein [Caldimonas sp. KR1-144]|uniref:hypothetical protein n=1 Tax=Caldimonas sp. KR1-144 TaxID=3400911 RepID=UPI003BFB47FE